MTNSDVRTHQLLWNSGGDSEPDLSFDKSASPERLFSLARIWITPNDLHDLIINYKIPYDLHPQLPSKDFVMSELPNDVIGIYHGMFDFSGVQILFSSFLLALIKHYRVHFSQLGPLGLNKVITFEVLCRSLQIEPTVTMFRVFQTLCKLGDWFSFTKCYAPSPACIDDNRSCMKHWKSGFFFIDRRAIPDVMVWRHPDVAIDDPRPAAGSFNIADVSRLSSRMEHVVLTNTDYGLWQVIMNGDEPIQTTKDENGVETEVPPKTAQAILARQKERKAKSIMLLAIPDEYQLRFYTIKGAKSLWAAIKSRFGGNVESKKMQKNCSKLTSKVPLDHVKLSECYPSLAEDTNSINESIVHNSDDEVLEQIDLVIWKKWTLNGRWHAFYEARICRSILIVHHKNEVFYEEKIAVLEFEVKDKDKTALEYGDQLNENDSSGSELFNSVFDSHSSDRDDNQINDRPTANKTSSSVSQVETSITPPSNTSVEMPRVESVRPSGVIIEDWVSDDDEDIFQSEDSQTTVKSSFKKIEVSKVKVNTVKVNGVNTTGQIAVCTVKGNGVTAVKASAGCVWRPKMTDLNNGSKDNSGSWISKRGNPQQALKYKGMFDSGCSRHMTRNKALLTDYQDIYGDLLTKAFDVTRFQFLIASIDKKELAIPGQTTTGKEFSNPLMADNLPKTILPTITATVETVNNREQQLSVTVDGQTIAITKTSVRIHLQLVDADGISSLPNTDIFEQLTLMSPKKTSWEQFSSNIATAIICMATNRIFKFSKLFFDGMGEGPSSPGGTQHTSTLIETSPQLQNISNTYRKTRTRTRRMGIRIPQTDVPTSVTDEAIIKEMHDGLVRDTTTASSLEAEQGSGNIAKTQTKATSSGPSSPRTSSEGGPGCHFTMGDIPVQARPERVSNLPNEAPLREGITSRSGEGSMQLLELINLYTKLSDKVTSLEDKLASTKAIYNKALITLTKRGRMIEEINKDETVNLVKSRELGKSHDTAEHRMESEHDDDDRTLAETLLNIKRSAAKEQAQILQDEDKSKLNGFLMKKEYLKKQIQNRLFSKAEVRKNMCTYLKNQGGYKVSHFKGMSYEDIRPIFERVWDQNQAFVPKDSEIEKEVMKREEFAMEIEYLGTKYPIVDWKTHVLTENFRCNGSTQTSRIKVCTSRPEGYDLMLWGDLKILFQPDEEDKVWRHQHEYNLISWRLFDSCGIHILLMNNGISIHMMIEKKYPLT
ncbi:hypothetical protein Tco_0045146 [Tanacetum coccineum]